MIRSDLSGYSNEYILVSGTIKITGAEDDDKTKGTEERSEGVIFKDGASFINCISSINNFQIDKAEYIDAVCDGKV